ncbi:MAG: hypothetical protein AAGU15_00240 [Anaerolineaceae bacterium]
MKKIHRMLLIFTLLSVLLVSGCGKKPTETSEPVNPLANMATTSWIDEPIKSTQAGLTVELLHVAQRGNDLVLRVKFPNPDWRNWYISKVKLSVAGGADYTDAKTEFFERLYQKDSNTYCLYQPSYNEQEKCIDTEKMDAYQIDDIIFTDLPGDLTGKKMTFEILELAVAAPYCEDLRIPYIEDALSKDFPGLTLECASGKRAAVNKISEASGYADNAEAQAAVQAMVQEAMSGSVSGPWTFEIMK